MASSEPTRNSSVTKTSSKGTISLVVAVGIVAIVLIIFPAYRVFFAVSLGLGIIIAGILYLRNKYAPIKDEDFERKCPLGL